MPRTKYRKKTYNGHEYFFYRFRHKNLSKPKDLTAKTAKELAEKIEELKFKLDRGVTSEKAHFSDYMSAWLNTVHLNAKKESTAKKYQSVFEKYLKAYPIAEIQMMNLTALDIQVHFEKLVQNGVSRPMLEILNVLIKPCIRYAYTQGKILTDFSRSIVLPEAKKKQEGTRRASRALTIGEENALIKVIANSEWEMLILTALNSGLRRGELLALTWDDVDFNIGLLSVDKSYSVQTKKVTTPKTESSCRKVPIPQPILDKLRRYKVTQNKLRLASANKYENNNLIFCRTNGMRVAPTTLNRALEAFAKEIGLDSLNMHDFRDTYATRMYEFTKDMKLSQALLGHSDISTTANIYTTVTTDEMIKNVSALNKSKAI